MLIIFRLLSVYLFVVAVLATCLTLQMTPNTEVSYVWGGSRYILSVWHFIPLVVLAFFGMFQRQ